MPWGVIGYVLAFVLAIAFIWAMWRLRQDRIAVVKQRGVLDEVHRADMALLKNQAQEAARVVREDANRLLEKSQTRASEIEADVRRRREELEAWIESQRAELRERRTNQERREARLNDREDRLIADAEGLEVKTQRLDSQRAQLKRDREELQAQRDQLDSELARVSGLSAEQARAEVMAKAEHDARLAATALTREIEADARKNGQRLAQRILVTAMQRMASEQTSESVISTVDLPSDEMKGRIIGREGRNIRAFEKVTGVNVMVDDTPESVLLSCFDPVRRETARMTLVELVADGRIHPARIEEVYERNTSRIAERIERAAEDALTEVGISDMHDEMIPILGSLTFRTSYGQNVLRHLVECAHLAGMMAAELGLDVAVCKRAAFLHDIGKALTHEIEGSHAIIGADLARKYGEHPDVVHAIEAHHNEIEPQTVEAVLVQAADAISGSRPGARRESLEAYVERMEKLETIASQHDGVDKVFAMQSGREVRVMVCPDEVDDLASQALARDIAAEIEHDLTYPGQIRVTVVRESRAIQLAH